MSGRRFCYIETGKEPHQPFYLSSSNRNPFIRLFSVEKICRPGAIWLHIILADPDERVLWSLRLILEREPEIEVIGEAFDASGLLALVERQPPDLALVDNKLPGMSLRELIARLEALALTMIVLVMSSQPEDGRLTLQAGADAFVSKGSQPDWLLESLKKYAKRSNTGGQPGEP
jgi:DNA-binding NarL/FixJ family response regulator